MRIARFTASENAVQLKAILHYESSLTVGGDFFAACFPLRVCLHNKSLSGVKWESLTTPRCVVYYGVTREGS